MKIAIILITILMFPGLLFGYINPDDQTQTRHAFRQKVLQNNINNYLAAENDGLTEEADSSLRTLRKNLMSLQTFGYKLKVDPTRLNDEELRYRIDVAMAGNQSVLWNVHGCLTVLFLSCGLSVARVPIISMDNSMQGLVMQEKSPPTPSIMSR